MTTQDVRNLAADIAQYTSTAVGNVLTSTDLNAVTTAQGNLWVAQNDCQSLISGGVDLNGAIAAAAKDILTQIGTLNTYLTAAVAAIKSGVTFVQLPDNTAASNALAAINGDLSTITSTANQMDANAAASIAAASAAAAAAGAAAAAAQYGTPAPTTPTSTSTPTTSTPTPTTSTPTPTTSTPTSTSITTSTPTTTLPPVTPSTPVTAAPPPVNVTSLSPGFIAFCVATGAVLVGVAVMHSASVPKIKKKRSRRR